MPIVLVTFPRHRERAHSDTQHRHADRDQHPRQGSPRRLTAAGAGAAGAAAAGITAGWSELIANIFRDMIVPSLAYAYGYAKGFV